MGSLVCKGILLCIGETKGMTQRTALKATTANQPKEQMPTGTDVWGRENSGEAWPTSLHRVRCGAPPEPSNDEQYYTKPLARRNTIASWPSSRRLCEWVSQSLSRGKRLDLIDVMCNAGGTRITSNARYYMSARVPLPVHIDQSYQWI